MPRVNIAADSDILDELEQEAKKKGYTLYAITNLALKAVAEILKEGGDSETLISLVEYYRIIRDLEIVPVTVWYLENLIKMAYDSDQKKAIEICETTGMQVASYLKTKASTISELLDIYDKIKEMLPIKDISVKQNGDTIDFRITGTGFGLESTTCAAHILKKILEEYGFNILSMTPLPGGIILVKAKANLTVEDRQK
ncbi:hypothetical protein [Sulfurisphaera ohwakuensis]|uniref:Uncharacterized protein n=1 Tax=Sulfurisphaera ohwakuensis TaxID=69656 RepID=A0A650CJ04_SULOH|nr:hypothetical protein [Sulfurisphaera ohwakuensis]MBB5253447.1 hypothetical protein [Sulfurisphaera ohwakuensis]QGR17759.1 hypothetical protein D1869_11660 [Sulfurisphaera ohwakuensis]